LKSADGSDDHQANDQHENDMSNNENSAIDLSQNDFPEADFRKGLEEFNAGQFFECHETLESVWNRQKGPEREFTQGIIQIAVAYYHVLRDNEKGALKLWTRGLARVLKFQPNCLGVEVLPLAEAVEKAIAHCEQQPGESKAYIQLPKIKVI
jgi:uncharacterized protein